jgi:CheY-like chemotaxis protein/Pyruvate/2-oxoacid:ferredoxin oxidoreductase delta subunit
MSALLSGQGYEVLTATDGFEALAEMREGLPDVLISDLKMPYMSGFELLSIVRKRFPSIAVIAMSAEFQLNSAPHVLADSFLRKGEAPPFEIVETIRELLAASPLRSQPAKAEVAPVWIPRSRTSYLVLTCPDCLRSFSVPQRDVQTGRSQEEACIHCSVTVQYCVDATLTAEPPAETSRVSETRKRVASTKQTIEHSKRLIDDLKRGSS